MVFLEFSGNQWFPLELRWRCSLNTLVFRIKSRHLSRFQGHMGFSLSHSRAVGMPLELKRETRGPFPVASWILEFLSIIKGSQASSLVEACNSAFLWTYQRGCEASCAKEVGN